MLRKSIQLICSDIDGTLLNKERALSPKTVTVLQGLAINYPIVLISSRMPQSMQLLQKELGIENQPLIAYNGSLILNQRQTLFSQEIPFSVLEKIVGYVESTDIHLSLYHKDEWLVPQEDYWAKRERRNTKVNYKVQSLKESLKSWETRTISAHKIMCMGDASQIDLLYKTLKDKHGDEIHIYRSKETYIEVSHIKQDKASALKLLLNKAFKTIDARNVIAFGDNYNDKTLLEQVGSGIAVANAKQEILAVANDICLSNIEDGVALYLEQNLV